MKLLCSYELKPTKIFKLPEHFCNIKNETEYRIMFNEIIIFRKKGKPYPYLATGIEVVLVDKKIDQIIFLNEGLFLTSMKERDKDEYVFVGFEYEDFYKQVVRVIKKHELEESLGE